MHDSSAELLDVVDPANGKRVTTRQRSEVHAEGLWHQVFHCLVVRPATRTIVLQRRASTKKAFPDQLDLTVTGHLEAGESPIDGIREAEEELGIALDRAWLVPLGTRLLADDNGEGHNRERVHLFFIADDRPLEKYRPPTHEVSALVAVGIDDFLAALADPALAVPATTVEAGTEVVTTTTLGRNDLVEGSAGYWVVLGVMAGRFADGVEPIAV